MTKQIQNPSALPASHMYNKGLEVNAANYVAISPISFIERASQVYPNKPAVIHGSLVRTWKEVFERSKSLASALQKVGVGLGDTVAVMLPNVPTMVEAHFGIPMSGAVLNSLNTRLDAQAIAFMLNHGEAKVVITDPEFSGTIRQALAILKSEFDRWLSMHWMRNSSHRASVLGR